MARSTPLQVACRSWPEFSQLLALLEAAPGKHAALCGNAAVSRTPDADATALQSVLIHPRLCAISIDLSTTTTTSRPASDVPPAAAAAIHAAVLSDLSPRPAASPSQPRPPPPPPLGFVSLIFRWPPQSEQPTPITADEIAALEKATASACGSPASMGGGRRFPGLGLRGKPPQCIPARTAAHLCCCCCQQPPQRGRQRRLRRRAAAPLPRRQPRRNAHAALAALLAAAAAPGGQPPSLETLSLSLSPLGPRARDDDPAAAEDARLLFRAVAQLLRLPGCRMRRLSLAGSLPARSNPFGSDCCRGADSLCEALRGNASLRELRVLSSPAPALGDALAGRGAPLTHLRVWVHVRRTGALAWVLVCCRLLPFFGCQ